MQVRPYREEDLSEVLRLMQAVYGDASASSAVWHWRHFGLGVPSCAMVAVNDDGRLAGQQPMELYDFSFAGRRLTGAVLTGVMVDPAFRRRGIFSAMLTSCEAEAWRRGAAFVTSMPNERSVRGFLRAGYLNPGPRTLSIHLRDPVTLLERARLPRSLARLVGRPGAAGLRLLTELLDRGRLPVERVSRLGPDAELDELSERFAECSPTLFQLRASGWVHWRYSSAPGQPYRLFAARQGGRLVGWAVGALDSRAGINLGYLVDALALTPAVKRSLALAACADLARAGAAAVVAVLSNASLAVDLARALFVPVPTVLSPKKFYTVYKPAPGRGQELAALGNLGHWHQTLGDWDTI